ncbi:MAG: PHP domain-containing protein [Candidatus Omnitrophica bacterium]|nr:PHP domain-containing protein [Candidatus Omnitrophota bacterium]MBU4473610.1 PHP domain-containing protein [Candidatus Omnitrophota bacterium]MCG2706327.1 PHP domain-containing protein [Candidatus Omnitrophota bacterium]
MRFADLHLHTLFSDGTYTPQELILEASKRDLSAIGLVDHDTVDGVEATFKAAKSKNIEVLAGIELSSEYDGKEIHILGYLIDYKNKRLMGELDSLKKNRIERAYKIIDKLKGMNIELEPKAVFAMARGGIVSRLHIAQAMVKVGQISSTAEAFRKYIGDKCPACVLDFKLSTQEAIKLIRDAGGIPVLAHPYTVNRDELISRFIDYGLMGLEVYYPEHTQSMVNFYLDLAKKFNLLVTGGSDCHGLAKPAVKIGSIKIPYVLVERLKEARKEL